MNGDLDEPVEEHREHDRPEDHHHDVASLVRGDPGVLLSKPSEHVIPEKRAENEPERSRREGKHLNQRPDRLSTSGRSAVCREGGRFLSA